jgi:hypothetical protein
MIGGNVTDWEDAYKAAMLRELTEAEEKWYKAVENYEKRKIKEEEEKRKRMFPTPWEKDL